MNSWRLNWPTRIPRLLWFRRQCPLCTSIVFESAELQSFDGLWAVFTLFSFRCVNWWRRYYCFGKKTEAAL